MKRPAFSFLFFVGMFLLPLFSMAHPGHGDSDGHTIIHYFSEPVHAVAAFSGIFIVVLAIYAYTRKRPATD